MPFPTPAEDVIWRAYVQTLLPYFGVNTTTSGTPILDNNAALYVCPITEQGIPAGSWVPAEITNNQLYSIADSLLPADSPIFIPGGTSYFQALQMYMAYVELDGNPSEEATQRMAKAQDAYNAAQAEFMVVRKAAMDAYSENPVKDMSFETWAFQNSPGYAMAWRAMHEVAAVLQDAGRDIYGPSASIYNQDYNHLILAMAVSEQPGCNMPCISEDVIDTSSVGKCPNMPNPAAFYRPCYFAQGYSDLITQWVDGFGTAAVIELNLDIRAAMGTTWKNFGFRNSNTVMPPLLAPGSGRSNVGNDLGVRLPSASSVLEMKVTYHGLQLIRVGTGIWDIPNVRAKYPRLRPDASANMIPSLVKGEQILAGYGPGMEATFDLETYDKMTSAIQGAMRAGKKMSFFGFIISDDGGLRDGLGGEQAALTVPFKKVEMHSETRKIVIPSVNSKLPVLVGVLGRRL